MGGTSSQKNGLDMVHHFCDSPGPLLKSLGNLNIMHRKRVGRNRRWWPMALLALLPVSGCAWFQGEPAFRDDTANWGEKHRPVRIGNGYGGVTSEAQQIERNLGIR